VNTTEHLRTCNHDSEKKSFRKICIRITLWYNIPKPGLSIGNEADACAQAQTQLSVPTSMRGKIGVWRAFRKADLLVVSYHFAPREKKVDTPLKMSISSA
jgi:hypothetical protein